MFERYSTRNGMPDNSVNCFLQDCYGILWLGTDGGLSRFDGIHFNNYYRQPSDSTGLPGNSIVDIFQPDSSQLLITTSAGQLVRYQYSTGRFTNLSLQPGFRHIEWRRGFRLRSGEVWYSTEKGIARLGRNLAWCSEVPMALSKPQTQSYAVHDIQEDEQGNFWLGTYTQQIVLYLRATGKFTQPFAGRLPLVQIHQLVLSSNGYTALAATGGNGLWFIDTRSHTVRALLPTDSKGTVYANITSVTETGDGRLAAGTITGLLLLDSGGTYVQHYTNVPGNPASLADNLISRIYKTADGNYWIASALGIQKTDFRAPAFRLLRKSPGHPYSTTAAHGQFTVVYSKDVTIYGHGGGITFYSAATGQKQTVVLPSGALWKHGIDPFCALLRGSTLWVGSWGGGLYRMQLVPGSVLPGIRQISHFTESLANGSGLPSDFVKHLSFDQGGNLLISTWGGGIARLGAGLLNSPNPVFSPLIPAAGTVRAGKYAEFCFRDVDGYYWFGNQGELIRAKGDFSSSETVRTAAGTPNGGLPITPAAVYKSTDSVYLIAGDGGAYLLRITGNGGYRLDNILHTPGIRCLQIAAGGGRYWVLSEKNNLYGLEPGGGNAPPYNLFNELDGFAWSYGTAGTDGAGTIYLGGMNGFAVFHPDSLRTAARFAVCSITGLHVPGMETMRGPDPLLKAGIELLHDNSGITIEFSAMEFGKPQLFAYRYRLLGSGEAWSEPTASATVTYSRLAPGDYIFEVQASDGTGFSGAPVTAFSILVPPPFYATLWFRLLLILLAAGIAGAYLRQKFVRLREERDTQEAFSKELINTQENERARVARELHDSIGQNLLVIKNLLGLYRKKKGRNDEDLQALDGVVSASIDEVRAISSSLHPHQLARFGVLAAVQSMVETVAGASGITITLSWDAGGTAIGPAAGIILYRIVQEALNNIIKHSGASAAGVAFGIAAGGAVLRIYDNGRGMPVHAAGGSGLLNMRERALVLHGRMETASAAGGGTELRFTFNESTLHD